SQALASLGLPGEARALGARGCVTLSPDPIGDHATHAAGYDAARSRLTWLYGMNRGLLFAPGRPEQWTLSVAHSREEVDAYVAVFGELCAELAVAAARGADARAAGHLAAT